MRSIAVRRRACHVTTDTAQWRYRIRYLTLALAVLFAIGAVGSAAASASKLWLLTHPNEEPPGPLFEVGPGEGFASFLETGVSYTANRRLFVCPARGGGEGLIFGQTGGEPVNELEYSLLGEGEEKGCVRSGQEVGGISLLPAGPVRLKISATGSARVTSSGGGPILIFTTIIIEKTLVECAYEAAAFQGTNPATIEPAPLTASFHGSAKLRTGQPLGCPKALKMTFQMPFFEHRAFEMATGEDLLEQILTIAVDSVSPSAGPTQGGTLVTIRGTGLERSATEFHFGTKIVKPATCTATTECSVAVPPHPVGTVNVKAVTHGVASPLNAPGDQFTYE